MRLSAVCTALFLGLAAAQPAGAADDPALLAADQALVEAARAGRPAAVAALLDGAVSWTDARGRTVTGAEAAPAFLTTEGSDERGARVRRFEDDRVAVVQVDRDPLHRLRVWGSSATASGDRPSYQTSIRPAS